MIARIAELQADLQIRCSYFKKFAEADFVKCEMDVPIIINHLLRSIMRLCVGTGNHLRTACRDQLTMNLDFDAVFTRQHASLRDSKAKEKKKNGES